MPHNMGGAGKPFVRLCGVEAKNAALRAAAVRLEARGIRVTIVPGEPLLGDDGEGTVDGTHPTDLGFLRMAEALETGASAGTRDLFCSFLPLKTADGSGRDARITPARRRCHTGATPEPTG